MFKLIKGNKLLYFISLILIVMYSSMDVGKSLLMGELFDNSNLMSSLREGLIIIVIFLSMYIIIMMLQQFTTELLKNKIRYNLNKNLYMKYLNVLPDKFEEFDSSTIINEFNNELSIIVDQYITSKLNVFYLVISFLFGSIYIGKINIYILLFLYLCGIATLLLNQSFSGKFKKNQKDLLFSQKEWINIVKNLCTNYKVIRNYNIEEDYENILDVSNEDLCKKQIKSNGFVKIMSSMNSGISQVMFFGTMLFGLKLIEMDLLTIGELIGIIQASNMIISPISNYMNLRNSINASIPILKSYDEKMNEECIDGQNNLLDDINDIKLENVNFYYKNNPILNNVSYEFKKGRKYLIIGSSGSGKSTLLKIISKQRKANNIYVNGIELNKISFSSYVKKFAYLTQENHLLPYSFKKNITLNKTNDNKFEDIIHNLYLDNFFAKQDKVFNEDNPEMSGGELQRMNLGRALFYDKSWLLLDEAFSSVDISTMIKIEKRILEDKNLTVLAISHKIIPEILKLYDEILIMKNGYLSSIDYDQCLNIVNEE